MVWGRIFTKAEYNKQGGIP